MMNSLLERLQEVSERIETIELLSILYPLSTMSVEATSVVYIKGGAVLDVDFNTLDRTHRTEVDTDVVFKKAKELGATELVFAHNHPDTKEYIDLNITDVDTAEEISDEAAHHNLKIKFVIVAKGQEGEGSIRWQEFGPGVRVPKSNTVWLDLDKANREAAELFAGGKEPSDIQVGKFAKILKKAKDVE